MANFSACPPTSTNNHGHYNKFSMWRSCSYSGPSILPPCRHPCQVYMIFLLSGKEDHFLNPQSAVMYTITVVVPYASSCTTLKVFMFQSTITLAVLCASPFAILEASLFQSIITILCANSPFPTPTVFLYRSFQPCHLLILTPEGLRPAPYRCS